MQSLIFLSTCFFIRTCVCHHLIPLDFLCKTTMNPVFLMHLYDVYTEGLNTKRKTFEAERVLRQNHNSTRLTFGNPYFLLKCPRFRHKTLELTSTLRKN